MEVARLGAKDSMKAYKKSIEMELERFFDREIASVPDDPLVRECLLSLKEFTLRDAKRVRAVLMTMGYLACGGKDIDRIIKASISMELVQSMLLIHDDLMDASDQRRGGPSFHRMFPGKGKDGRDIGPEMAIIGGDLAESLAESVLVNSGFPPEMCLKAVSLQSEMVKDTGYGQIMDVSGTGTGPVTEDRIIAIHRFKTARYTFEGPLTIGGALAGASGEMMAALSGYGDPVGISFQIMDDVLGFLGDPKKGGEADISDIREGKATFVMLDLLEKCGAREREFIIERLGSSDLTMDDAKRFRTLAADLGVLDRSRERARSLVAKGIRSLEEGGLDPTIVSHLSELAIGLLERV